MIKKSPSKLGLFRAVVSSIIIFYLLFFLVRFTLYYFQIFLTKNNFLV